MKVRLLASALLLFFAVSGYGQATTALQLRMVTGNFLEPTVTTVNPNIPLDVGSLPVAQSVDVGQMAVLNTDSVPHTLTNVTVATGTDFSLSTAFSGSIILQPNVQVTLSPGLLFQASAAGSRSGQLSLFDDEPGSPQKFALTGTGYTDFGMFCDNGGLSLFSIDFYCTQQLTAGQSGVYFLRLSSINSFSGQVTMTCSGLPQGTSCTFAPASFLFTAPQSFQDVELTVTTTARAASLPFMPRTLWWACLVVGAITLAGWRKRPARRLLFGLAFAAFLLSCGGGNSGKSGPTPSGTFPFTFTATANGVSHSKTLTLVVK